MIGYGAQTRVGLVAACTFPAPRGSQVLVHEMATALASATVEPHLIAPGLARRGSFPAYAFHPSPLPRVPRPGRPLASMVRALFDARLVVRAAEVARRERLHVLHAHNYEGLAAALVVGRMCRVPVVYHSHNVLADELPEYAPPPLRRAARSIGRWCDRVLPRRADQVIVLSEDVAAHLAALGVRRERIEVIPPGLDPTPFAGAVGKPRAPRAVFAGNLDGYQNLDLLLDAWGLAENEAGAVELTLLTHAPTRALERRVRRRGLGRPVRIVRARSLAQVANELSSAIVGVSPRRSWSGFPVKTLNYMASGLATIAVEDTGRGIPPDDIVHVFERFWRGPAVRETAGSGVGLAVVQELVRAHGGNVDVTSEEGHGSRFVITIPSV